MKYRRLGKGGPEVSAISMGRGSQAVQFGTPLEAGFNSTIHRALDLGINFFDSSDLYWNTRHEVLIGRALKGRRDKALIATKFGNIDLPDGKKGTNGKPDYVYSSCEASLKRLGTDVIDVYFMHRVDPNTPIEETVGAMARLIEQGKVRWIVFAKLGRQRCCGRTRRIRSLHCRRSTRCGRVIAKRKFCRRVVRWASRMLLTRRSDAGCSPEKLRASTICRLLIGAASTRASMRKISPAMSRWSRN